MAGLKHGQQALEECHSDPLLLFPALEMQVALSSCSPKGPGSSRRQFLGSHLGAPSKANVEANVLLPNGEGAGSPRLLWVTEGRGIATCPTPAKSVWLRGPVDLGYLCLLSL